jgi:leucine dehydrogenase
MSVHLLEVMSRDGFEEVQALHDRDTGATAFLAIHDSRRGPAFGGIRRRAYRDEREALGDCLNLARAMSHKCALLDLPAGGAKLVLVDQPDLDPRRAYAWVGRMIERQAGRLYAGPDLGTGPQELEVVARSTRYVTAPGPEGPGLLAEATAEGVFAGLVAGLEHLDGEADLTDRRIVVQGLGQVGSRLARRLAQAGATVLGAETDVERGAEVARELGIELVDPAREMTLSCDVFAPCAMGGILHEVSVERLQCRMIAGAANNVLARADHAERLHERGILYLPDIVLTAGALIRGALFHLENHREPLDRIGARIAASVRRVLHRAHEEDAPPARVAERDAQERLARHGREPEPRLSR